ncbi:MAG: acetate uptake transporter [Solirubrobacterales bacterium]|nr:acetate uptake transporter [Solirubrobacterales bacterium]
MATISEPRTQAGSTPAAGTGSSWAPANPAALGLAVFGITTMMLSIMNANLVTDNLPAVATMALAVGGIPQLLAGMWEFRNGNTLGAVAFSAYGGFWISFYFLVHGVSTNAATNTVTASSLGLYLWCWTGFTAVMFICSLAGARAVQAVFLLLTLTFAFLAIGASGGHLAPAASGATMTNIGGYLGIVTAIAALYTSAAEIMAATYKHDVLPLGRPVVHN